jgi:methyltransferase
MSISVAVLAFVTLQRLAELAWARRNVARLMQRGGREVAAEHYPLIVALHASWLIGLWLLAPGMIVHGGWLILFFTLQIVRIWVLVTLKDRWTTRIIVVANEPLVRAGPYRFLNHPNYWVVAGEILTLPLSFGLVVYALIFSALNGLILSMRIREENRALAS